MADFKKKRTLYALGFFLFAAIIPIVVISLEFDLYSWASQASTVLKITGAGAASIVVVLFALRRRLATWLEDLDPQPMKSIIRGIMHLSPYLGLLLFMGIVKDHIETLYHVFFWCILSNAISVFFDDRVDYYNFKIKREKDKDKLREVLTERGL